MTNGLALDNLNIYCTLFNSSYLDKALVLIDSLSKRAPNFKLYVFGMDKKVCELLTKMNLDSVIVVDVGVLEDEKLLALKHERSFAEYCWTWTPLSIYYVLTNFSEKICTYIDADMMFYQDPAVLVQEMLDNDSEVLLVKHNFPKENKDAAECAGTFCVEFNTFLNTKNSLKTLKKWRDQCIEDCSYSRTVKKTHGDQKYLDDWPNDYPWAHVLENIGGGVAPWNNMRYSFSMDDDRILLNDLEGDATGELIFYHFQNIRFLPFGLVNIGLVKKNKFARNVLYKDYLYRINKKREYLKKEFGLTFSFNRSTYRNKLLRFLQIYVVPFRLRHLSNLMGKKGKLLFK